MALAIAGVYYSKTVYRHFYSSYLFEKHNTLIDEYYLSRQKIDSLQSKAATIERNNIDLRTVASIPPLHEDFRSLGFGGQSEWPSFDLSNLPAEIKSDAMTANNTLEKLEQKSRFFVEERRDIISGFAEQRHKLKHTPSIRPVMSGRVSDYYGMRTDPFTKHRRHHKGIDISAPEGTEVYASAAGVVIKTELESKRNRGYGKEIIIDHGDSLKTRYAHLSEILVKEGQNVTRWDVIGRVGQTGRSTAPHLHYEVLVNDQPVRPRNYIIDGDD